ncbi:MAG: DNA-directed RNA polymerase subunit beta', partial [Mycoplasmataceae bacterium]|nr:DNA-directed RNA polymerase subunit beta' [Mycoplasmataceae bacterium]
MTKSKIKALQIGIASPEQIRSWSHGEITKSETINYKTLKPERSGLFDEAIFGPVKDYECACGKYKKVKYKGKICEKCGVEIIESIVRRERMGHIELAAPVAHIWMSKELPSPSKISLVLDVPYKQVEEVIYFVNHIVLNSASSTIFKDKEIIDLTSPQTSKTDRQRLIRVLKEIKAKVAKDSIDYKRADEYYKTLKNTAMPFSIEQVFNFIHKHTNVRFGIGAEAIYELLHNVDLQKESVNIQNEMIKLDPNNPRFRKLMRRLEVIRWFIESNNKPEWMILKVIPVTPPDTRPIIQLDGGRFTTSDINNFYRKIIIRNDRLKKMIELNVPSIILNNEKRMLQEAVDALFDNASRSKPVMSKDKRPLKSLSDHLKGKQGLFRQNLLGKRVDYSGRSVIVIGPELKMYEVGIPSIMILKLFRPFIIRELIKKFDNFGNEIKPIATNVKSAEKMILHQENVIWPIVQKIIKERPVLLNRAPTLHRLGIQAFEPKMIDGKAIRLHPLVTTAFNADFDGDQMAVHVPLSPEAVAEARNILLASWHILGPKDGKPVITPTQDMILGVYYLSTEQKDKIGEGTIFASTAELLKAYALNQVHPHTIVGITTSNYPHKKFPRAGTLITTVGKVILNNVLPADMVYINDVAVTNNAFENEIIGHGEDVRTAIAKWTPRASFTKKTLQAIVSLLYLHYSVEVVAKTMDGLKNLGFRFSTKSATTVSAYDIPKYDKKYDYFKAADEAVSKLKRQFQKGLLTDDERYKKVVSLWTEVKDKVSADVEDIMTDAGNRSNSIVVMAKSGARGNVSQFTQLMGMRGLMSKS